MHLIFTVRWGDVRHRRHLGDLPVTSCPKWQSWDSNQAVGSGVPAGFLGKGGTPPALGTSPVTLRADSGIFSPGFKWASQKQSSFSGLG